jgi:hypothetical protein
MTLIVLLKSAHILPRSRREAIRLGWMRKQFDGRTLEAALSMDDREPYDKRNAGLTELEYI